MSTSEPRCIGHHIGTGYSHYGLAKNCPHAECKALVAEAFALHPERPWHDDWAQRLPHGDHQPTEDCLRCYTARLWSSFEALRQQNALLSTVAHRAWHLLDDGGEQDDDPDEFVAFMSDAKRLSDALDALEATGWDAHDPSPAASDGGPTDG